MAEAPVEVHVHNTNAEPGTEPYRSGPQLLSPLLAAATDHLVDAHDDNYRRIHVRAAERQGGHVRHLVQEAYKHGLRDGYVQGATDAEAARA